MTANSALRSTRARRFSSPSTTGWHSHNYSLLGRVRVGSDSPGNVSDNELRLRSALTDTSDNEHDDDAPSGTVSDTLFRTPLHRPLIYTSLPPTPISRSPGLRPVSANTPTTPVSPLLPAYESTSLAAIPTPQQQGTESPKSLSSGPTSAPSPMEEAPQPLFSLWDYLREELLATDFDSHQELKWERVSNFLQIPYAIEKIVGFGFILCLDSFLYTFTIMPIRFLLAVLRLIGNILRISPPPLPPSQKADILRALLLVVSVVILSPLTDASQIYHSIRGQDTIKLYVIFNALEIADRLCASIGQDILDCLFSRSTLEPLSHRRRVGTHTLKPFIYFVLATMYNVAHALVMVYQLISMNVAVNSYDHALLTLLVSNQFVEIKGSVFKKFEKDSLFQITCADIVERFSLTLMLWIVAFRNLVELSGSEFDFAGGFVLPKSFLLPKSFSWFRVNNVLWTISYPVMSVLISEMIVDWLKHAFITKYNHIRPSVYERFTDVLCRDLASGSAVGRKGVQKHTYVDQSPLVARRLGFASLPLAVVAILIGFQSINLLISLQMETSPMLFAMLDDMEFIHGLKWIIMGVLIWLCTLCIKVIIGVYLLEYAKRRQMGMEVRKKQDVVNDFGRDPIGEGKEERQYNKDLQTLLNNQQDDALPVPDMGERKPSTKGDKSGGGKKDRVKLEDLTRYTMVKRIW